MSAARAYSYVCPDFPGLELCLGVSAGSEPPKWYPTDPLRAQLKRRVANQNTGLDEFKLKWTATSGRIAASSAPYLVLAALPGTNVVALVPGNATGYLTDWVATYPGTLRLGNRCAGVAKCARGPDGFCDPSSDQPIESPDEAVSGTYVRLFACGTAPTASKRFVARTDCAPGCSVFMTLDSTCQLACANDACGWDSGACDTPSPTPPTLSPTNGPSTSPTIVPTASPSTETPTSSPVSSEPSASPSLSPSTGPSSSAPSRSPSARPTRTPSTERPSRDPSRAPATVAPTFAPTRAPSSAPAIVAAATLAVGKKTDALYVLLVAFFVLLFCFVCVFVRRRRRAAESKPSSRLEPPSEEPKPPPLPEPPTEAFAARFWDEPPPRAAPSPLETVDVESLVVESPDVESPDVEPTPPVVRLWTKYPPIPTYAPNRETNQARPEDPLEREIRAYHRRQNSWRQCTCARRPDGDTCPQCGGRADAIGSEPGRSNM